MNPLKKQFLFWIGVLVFTFTLGDRAQAFMGECYFALDADTLSKLSTKHVIKVKDGVFHQSFTVDLGNATLATLRPGDKVTVHGETHFVLEINKRTLWTQFIFINQEDIGRFTDYLAGNSKPHP